MKKYPQVKAISDYFWWVLVGAMVGSPFIAVYGQWYGYLPELHITSWLVVITPLLWAVFLWFNGRYWRWKFDKYLLPLGLFIAWATLSFLWAINKYEALYEWLQWVSVACLSLLVLQCLSNDKRLQQLLWAIFISGVLCASFGILQFLFNVEWVQQGSFPSSTLFNRNITNQFLVLTLPAGLALFFSVNAAKQQYILAVGAALILVYVFYSTTRAAALTVVTQGFLLIIWLIIKAVKAPELLKQGVRLKALLLFILLGLLLAHTTAKGFNPKAIAHYLSGAEPRQLNQMESVEELQFNFNQSTEVTIRQALWLNSLPMIADYPIHGVGLGNWNIMYPKYHQARIQDAAFSRFASPTNAHQDFLHIFAELGLIGISLLLTILFIISKASWQTNRPAMGLALLLVLVGITIEGSFSFPLQLPMPKMTLILWFIIAVYILCDNQQKQAKANSHVYLTNQSSVAIISIALFIGTVLLYQWQEKWYRAEVANRKATTDKRYKRYDAMLANAQQSAALNPLRKRLLYLVASGYEVKGDYVNALDAYEQQLVDYPYMLFGLYQAMNAHIQLKQYQQALDKAQRYVAIKPDDADIHKALGIIYYQYLKQVKPSLGHFKKALELDPNLTSASEIRRLLTTHGMVLTP